MWEGIASARQKWVKGTPKQGWVPPPRIFLPETEERYGYLGTRGEFARVTMNGTSS